jgi:hypothetical protein
MTDKQSLSGSLESCKLCGQPKYSIETIARDNVDPIRRTYNEYREASHNCLRCTVVVKATEACISASHPANTEIHMHKVPTLGLHIVFVSQTLGNG